MLSIFGLNGAIYQYIVKSFSLDHFSLPVNELSLVRLAVDLVD